MYLSPLVSAVQKEIPSFLFSGNHWSGYIVVQPWPLAHGFPARQPVAYDITVEHPLNQSSILRAAIKASSAAEFSDVRMLQSFGLTTSNALLLRISIHLLMFYIISCFCHSIPLVPHTNDLRALSKTTTFALRCSPHYRS